MHPTRHIFARRFATAALGLLFVLLTACDRGPEPLKLSGFTMGTTYHVTVADAESADADALQKELDELLIAFNEVASTYISDSELNRLNRASADEWHPISDTLFDMLFMSMELSWLTSGAFDVTVAPLVNLWGFGPEGEPRVPAQEELDEALQRVGFQHMEIDFADPKVRKTRDITLDLSAIAKGYGVDLVALWLERKGYGNFMVEIGGEVVARGSSPRGDAWRIGIEQPAELPGSVNRAIRISDVGVATSGDYRNYFEAQGKRYSHIINPVTGRPVEHSLVSVTVISETAAYADALATAFTVMGPEKTRRFAEQHEIAVYLIEKTADGLESSHSSAFANYLE